MTGHPFDIAQGAEALEALSRGFRRKGQGVFKSLKTGKRKSTKRNIARELSNSRLNHGKRGF
jgi:hypothetical protein